MEQEIERCQRCGVEEEDLRTLWSACFYALEELGLPFSQEVLFRAESKDLAITKKPESIDVGGQSITIAPARVKCEGELTPNHLYCLRICKDCRADWMHAMVTWFKEVAPKQDVGSGIFVREFGTCKEITREEWDSRDQKS